MDRQFLEEQAQKHNLTDEQKNVFMETNMHFPSAIRFIFLISSEILRFFLIVRRFLIF